MRAYKQNWVDFTAVPNEIFRHKISLKAIGLYVYIASKPDGWDFSIAGASTQLKDAKTSIQSAIRELEVAGFLKRVQNRKPEGGFGKCIWYVCGRPDENPSAQNVPAQKHAQVMTDKVMTKRGVKNLLTIGESTRQELVTEFEVKRKSLDKACQKYLLHCESKGLQPNLAGLKLWLSNERWGEDDYSVRKTNRMAREAILNGEW